MDAVAGPGRGARPACLAACLLLATLMATGSGRRLGAQVATPGDSVIRSWHVTLPYRRGQVIWVQNLAPDTLHLQQVTVSRCLNVGAGCGVTSLELSVPPGDSVATITIRPKVWDDRYVYSLSWEWTLLTPGSTTPSAPP